MKGLEMQPWVPSPTPPRRNPTGLASGPSFPCFSTCTSPGLASGKAAQLSPFFFEILLHKDQVGGNGGQGNYSEIYASSREKPGSSVTGDKDTGRRKHLHIWILFCFSTLFKNWLCR